MKKLFAKIISLTVAVVMSLFMFSGCQLVTKNAERDMNQVIATVAVDNELKQDVYKRELVSSFNSMGYYYVQYQGMTEKETYELLLENIIKNRILVQQARIELTKDGGYYKNAVGAVNSQTATDLEKFLAYNNYKGTAIGDIKKTDKLDLFLTEYEYYESVYSVLSTVDQYIDAYKDMEEEEHEHDPYETFQGAVRSTLTIPTEETYNEWEMRYDEKGKVIDVESDFYKSFEKLVKDAELGIVLSDYTAENSGKTKYDLALDVYKAYYEKFEVKSDERTAVNRLVKDLKLLGFVPSSEKLGSIQSGEAGATLKADDFLNLSYFKQELEGAFEDRVITKYELALQNEHEKLLAEDEALWEAYVNIYKTQQASFDNDYTAYETALEKANDTNLVVYNPSDNYGYVMNLLIGFSEEQSAIYDSLMASTKLTAKQKADALTSLLKTLTAKDLRDTWVEGNYGTYNAENGTFKFDSKYVKTEALQSYNGKIYGAKEYVYHDNYENEKTGYSYSSVKGTEIAFTDFYKDIVCDIMGFNPDSYSGKVDNYTSADLDKFKDLVFAYSTDGGSLKDNYGYVYSPKTSKDTYVEEFATAAKKAVEGGVGSYEVIATEFGYHIILCTKVIEKSVTFIDKDTFIAQANDKSNKETIPYLFKEYQKDSLVLDIVSKKTETFFKNAIKDKVTYFADKYEDLIAE